MDFNRKEFLQTLGLGVGGSVLGYDERLFSKLHPRIFPKTLAEGATIGMISPASSLPEETEYDKVKETIEELGFKVQVGIHARDHFGYFAGTDENRAKDLNAMFADPEIDAILPFRGGWGSNRILEFLDFDLIRNNPKPLIGFSDITTLLLAIYARTGLITFHGPVGTSTWSDFTTSYFNKALMKSKPYSTGKKDSTGDENGITTIYPGKAEGSLLGGNLTVLTSMMGSDYLPDFNNSLLFLEDVGEDVYRIDRMLTQLKLNNVFDKISGLIFGKCTNCSVSEGYHFTLEQILDNHINPYEIPAFTGANIGHIEDMVTLPIGIRAVLNADSGIIKLSESPTAINN